MRNVQFSFSSDQIQFSSLLLLLQFILLFPMFAGAQYSLVGKVVDASNGRGVFARISIDGETKPALTDSNGSFSYARITDSLVRVKVSSLGFQSKRSSINLPTAGDTIIFLLDRRSEELDEFVLYKDKSGEGMLVGRLGAVDGTAIYAGKKNEVIVPEKLAMNKATNNARQVFARVPGINIWESDGGGLQMGIGGRGLSPNRNANFNVRQNGYDISADALGYPESYYTPPIEALDRIEVVRGAASLQYGTQFGGLINFVLKQGKQDTPIEWVSRHTGGSWKFYNTFNSLSGSTGGFRYYAAHQFKRGDGWRPNSGYQSHTALVNFKYAISKKINLGFEYTYLYYLAQQPGGLTDAQFAQDARQSFRSRNWFKVNWNLFALTLDYIISERSKLNIRNFALSSGRFAVGILERINEIDRGQERDLLADDYLNFGSEIRFIHRYSIRKQPQTILTGVRVYGGRTKRAQGFADDGAGPVFRYLNPSNPGKSDYVFPGFNFAWFAEQVFQPLPGLTITPGIRVEFISTSAAGNYNLTLRDFAGNIISDTLIGEERSRKRGFALLGLGISYKPFEFLETYANFSQNYRSITFSDLRVVNPNFKVDPNISDERGFNADLGFRGTYRKRLNYDVSGFLLAYNNRIGQVFKNDTAAPFLPYRFRGNIGKSLTIGIEAFAEIEFLQWFGVNPEKYSLSLFGNASYIRARYTQAEDPAIVGKEVELVPPFLLRGGLTAELQKLRIAFQASYVRKHFTDATNAEFTSSAVNGIIPSYYVLDLSLQYPIKWFQIEAGVNNLTNNRYYTRRAEAYPGPGIIPSDALSFYVGMQFRIQMKTKRKDW